MIRVQGVSWGVRQKSIIDNVTAEFSSGKITAILGPNGSGKTSLLHVIAGIRRPTAGAVLIDGMRLSEFAPRQRARRIALVEQHPSTELDLVVREIVALGRIPHIGGWPGAQDVDAAAIDEAMVVAEISDFAERRWTTLSGGERQRVHLARALAQRPKVLLLDEPTNHLDLAHQLSFLETVAGLGVCTVVVLHDLDLAAAYADDVLVMSQGRVRAGGAASDILSPGLIEQVFGVRAVVTRSDRLRVSWSRQ